MNIDERYKAAGNWLMASWGRKIVTNSMRKTWFPAFIASWAIIGEVYAVNWFQENQPEEMTTWMDLHRGKVYDE